MIRDVLKVLPGITHFHHFGLKTDESLKFLIKIILKNGFEINRS